MSLLLASAAVAVVLINSAAVDIGSDPERLQAVVSAAIRSGAASAYIPGGLYRFAHGTSLLIHSASDLAFSVPDPVELVFSGAAGVSIVNSSRISIGNISIDYNPVPTKAYPSITYALVNSSDVCTEDLTIRSAPYMAITAFTGGGNHTFRRLRFSRPRPGARWTSQRDAIHFSDVRIGPTIEESSVGFCGDDFLNIKNTLMLLLQCESASSCIVIGPHVAGEQPIPFGGTSVLATARPGDRLSFYAWPNNSMIMPELGGKNGSSTVTHRATVASLGRLAASATTTAALVAQAARLEKSLIGIWPWTAWTNQTMSFGSSELWRVNFSAALPSEIWSRSAPERVTMINIDNISCANSQIRSSNFTDTGSQLGRFKSPGGSIVDNRFDQGNGAYNLEFSALPQWLEGPIKLDGITVSGNIFVRRDGNGKAVGSALPFHCGPRCEAECIRNRVKQQCMAVNDPPCPTCPNCSAPTLWAQLTLLNNRWAPSQNNTQSINC